MCVGGGGWPREGVGGGRETNSFSLSIGLPCFPETLSVQRDRDQNGYVCCSLEA